MKIRKLICEGDLGGSQWTDLEKGRGETYQCEPFHKFPAQSFAAYARTPRTIIANRAWRARMGRIIISLKAILLSVAFVFPISGKNLGRYEVATSLFTVDRGR